MIILFQFIKALSYGITTQASGVSDNVDKFPSFNLSEKISSSDNNEDSQINNYLSDYFEE